MNIKNLFRKANKNSPATPATDNNTVGNDNTADHERTEMNEMNENDDSTTDYEINEMNENYNSTVLHEISEIDEMSEVNESESTDAQYDTNSMDYTDPYSSEYQESKSFDEDVFIEMQEKDSPEKNSIATKFYNAFAILGFPLLILFTILLNIQYFVFPRPLRFLSESLYADIYMSMQQSKEYLLLTLNGQPYAEFPPLYFLYLTLVGFISDLTMPELIFASNAIIYIFFISMARIFARSIGYNKYIALGAALICLSSLYFYSTGFAAGLGIFSSLDIFFATLSLMAFTCFYRGLIAKSAPFWLTLAFLFSTAAVLTKGPIAILFFIIPSLFFTIWLGNAGRINQKDGVFGFALMLIILAAWILFFVFDGQLDYVQSMMNAQITIPLNSVWWQNIILFSFLLFPWIFVIIFVNWNKSIRACSEIRHDKQKLGGGAWLWFIMITGLAISCIAQDTAYIAAIFTPAAIMFSRTILNLTPGRSRIFFGVVALNMFLLGIFFIILQFNSFFKNFLPLESFPVLLLALLQTIAADSFFLLLIIGILFLILSIVLFQFTKKSSPKGALFVACVGFILCTLPINYFIPSKINHLLSMEDQITLLNSRYPQGYTLATYQTDADIYAFYYKNQTEEYSNTNVVQINDTSAMYNYLASTQDAILILPQESMEELFASEIMASRDFKNEIQVLDTFLAQKAELVIIKLQAPRTPFNPLESMPVPDMSIQNENRENLTPSPSPLIEKETEPSFPVPDRPSIISPENTPDFPERTMPLPLIQINPEDASQPANPENEIGMPKPNTPETDRYIEDDLEPRIMEPVEL